MSFFKQLFPKKLSSQLLLLVAVSLIVAQILNLFILVGETRLRAQSNTIKAEINSLINRVQDLPSIPIEQLPYKLRGREYRQGDFHLASTSLVESLGKSLLVTGYDKLISEKLNQRGIYYQDYQIAIRPHSLSQSGPPFFENNTFLGNDTIFDNNNFPPSFENRRSKGRDKNFPPPFAIDRVRPTSEILISIQLPSGIWFNSITPYFSNESLTPKILFSTLALLSITLIGIAFFMRRISQPLSAFADAAEEFGRGQVPNELSENGPDDIRIAAQAFNQMQRRLSRTMETQNNMLRAVSHDLRTPLTSLRIRSEMLPEKFQREKIIATIDEMSAMTEEILSWTKNAAGLEEPAAVDLQSLLSSIVDDYTDQGHNIKFNANTNIILNVRRLAIKRALNNVISNAIKYGHSASLNVQESDRSILIHITDQGPGIPDHLLSDALKPFVRLEASRNKDTGGSGLGLSITETIVQAEGGKLLFKNLDPEGFRVSISLPK